MEIIETGRIRDCFTRALSSYGKNAGAQHDISHRLASLLPRRPDIRYRRMLEIGCGTGGFTRALKQRCSIDEWVLNDLCENCMEKISRIFPEMPPQFIAGDAETTVFPGRFDLIASASVFQWIRDPETFFHKLSGLLIPHGALLFSTFTPGNLHEIKELTGKGLTYPSPADLTRWLSADFTLRHCREEEITLTFDTPLHVLKHLKATGVTATGGGFWTKGMQETFCKQYIQRFSTTDHQVTLTYRPLYVRAVKKETTHGK